jgi:hypothetical protein
VLENLRSRRRYTCDVEYERDGYECTAADATLVRAVLACDQSQTRFETESASEPGVAVCRYECAVSS